MEQIIVLDVKFKFGDRTETIHPTVLLDEKDMVLVDCGYTGGLPNLEFAMEEAGLDPAQLTAIFITHHDHDHMGALAAFKRKYPPIKIIAGETETPYITGEKKSLRITQAEALQRILPDEQQAFGQAFLHILRSVEPAQVNLTVRGGDVLPWCGGCILLATPGHTPGHLSLYLKAKHTMVAGDAAVSESGTLAIANPQFTLDMENAQKSLQAIQNNYDAESIICYHGGIYQKKFD